MATDSGDSPLKQEQGIIVPPRQGILIPNRVFVGGIPQTTTEHELRSFFEQFGNVRDVKIIFDENKISRGYGFITYEMVEDAQKVVKKYHDDSLEFSGRQLNVGPAVKQRTTQTQQQQHQLIAGIPPSAIVLGTGNGLPATMHNGMLFFPSTESHNLAQPAGSPFQGLMPAGYATNGSTIHPVLVQQPQPYSPQVIYSPHPSTPYTPNTPQPAFPGFYQSFPPTPSPGSNPALSPPVQPAKGAQVVPAHSATSPGVQCPTQLSMSVPMAGNSSLDSSLGQHHQSYPQFQNNLATTYGSNTSLQNLSISSETSCPSSIFSAANLPLTPAMSPVAGYYPSPVSDLSANNPQNPFGAAAVNPYQSTFQLPVQGGVTYPFNYMSTTPTGGTQYLVALSAPAQGPGGAVNNQTPQHIPYSQYQQPTYFDPTGQYQPTMGYHQQQAISHGVNSTLLSHAAAVQNIVQEIKPETIGLPITGPSPSMTQPAGCTTCVTYATPQVPNVTANIVKGGPIATGNIALPANEPAGGAFQKATNAVAPYFFSPVPVVSTASAASGTSIGQNESRPVGQDGGLWYPAPIPMPVAMFPHAANVGGARGVSYVMLTSTANQGNPYMPVQQQQQSNPVVTTADTVVMSASKHSAAEVACVPEMPVSISSEPVSSYINSKQSWLEQAGDGGYLIDHIKAKTEADRLGSGAAVRPLTQTGEYLGYQHDDHVEAYYEASDVTQTGCGSHDGSQSQDKDLTSMKQRSQEIIHSIVAYNKSQDYYHRSPGSTDAPTSSLGHYRPSPSQYNRQQRATGDCGGTAVPYSNQRGSTPRGGGIQHNQSPGSAGTGSGRVPWFRPKPAVGVVPPSPRKQISRSFPNSPQCENGGIGGIIKVQRRGQQQSQAAWKANTSQTHHTAASKGPRSPDSPGGPSATAGSLGVPSLSSTPCRKLAAGSTDQKESRD